MKRKSLALFTAACLLLAALAPAALAAPPAMSSVPEVTLTVDFDDDAGGGNSTTDNPMRTRVLNAVEALKLNNSSVTTTGAITTIQLTGSAASITGYNWIFLYTALFDRGLSNLWTNLRTLDLSGMRDLRTVSGDNFSLSAPRDGTVLLPDSLQTIGDSAFLACTALASLTLPNGLQTIGDNAFAVCTSLASLTLPAGLQSIGDYAFDTCTALTSLTLPAGLQSIGDRAFFNCSSLISLTLPDGVPTIGDSAFLACTALASLTLPAGLQSIGPFAFYDCTSLKTLRFRGQTAPTLDLNTVGGIWMFAGVSPALTLWVPESGRGYLGPAANSDWRELVSQHDISIQTYSLAAASAPSAYSLTVEQGAGGGWYRAGDSVTLKAIPPVEGAAFLRWELLSGYGDFADPASPETKFTMQIDNAAVRAVFELPAATTPPKTGDSDGATLPLLTLAALAGFAALCLRRTRRFRTK